MFGRKILSAFFLLLLANHLFGSSRAYPLSTGLSLKTKSLENEKKTFGRKGRKTISLRLVPQLCLSYYEKDEEKLPASISTLLDNLGNVEEKKNIIHSRTSPSGRACEDIKSEVTQIVAGQLGVTTSEAMPEARFSDLGFDSLGRVELLSAVGEVFNINISDQAAEQLTSVGELIQFVVVNGNCH